MKKCISLLLCLALALSCCAACAEAAPEAAEPAAHVLEKKEYPVYNGRMTLLYQALPLYFVDGVNDLPYVDLTDFGRRMDGETLNAVTRRIEDAVWGLSEN